MYIQEITENKKQYLDLLLLADEQESMIDRYLERGKMYVLYDNDELISVCVVTPEGTDVCELKNIATHPRFQRQGYGKRFIEHLCSIYRNDYKTMLVGTGDIGFAVSFYESCGFVYSHRIPDFFTEHYDHPIFEDGTQLIDMIYLKKEL